MINIWTNAWFYIWLGTFIFSNAAIILVWRLMSRLYDETAILKNRLIILHQYYQIFLAKLNSLDKLGAFAEHDELGIFFTIIRKSIHDIEKYFDFVQEDTTKPPE